MAYKGFGISCKLVHVGEVYWFEALPSRVIRFGMVVAFIDVVEAGAYLGLNSLFICKGCRDNWWDFSLSLPYFWRSEM